MDDIESSVTELQRLILAKAPHCRPAVFPSNMKVNSIYDLCDSQTEQSPHRAQILRWLDAEQTSEEHVAFTTEFDYTQRTVKLVPKKCDDETDKCLFSLEQMMSLYVSGTDKNLMGIVNARFLERNNYDEQSDSAINILYEVCNLSYSLKVLISNIPGVKFSLEGHSLPLSASEDAFSILQSVSRSSKKVSRKGKAAEEEEEEEVEPEQGRSAKKRRKKRGGG
jgi:hypothetical protein